MATFSIEIDARKVAEKAINEIEINGRTIKDWVKLIVFDKDYRKTPCRYCYNARVADPSDFEDDFILTDENDGSYCTIGETEKKYRIGINSGFGRPVEILFEHWNDKTNMNDLVGFYRPNFCPNCGRILNEYEKEKTDL